MPRSGIWLVTAILLLFPVRPSFVHAQSLEPLERVSFREAIDRALANNPSVAVAAAGILRADGLLSQARSATLLQVSGNVTTTTLNTGVSYQGTTVTPQNQLNGSLAVGMPVDAVAWARRAQVQDNQRVAELSMADTRRQIALATADAYLAIIASRRIVETNVRARDTARAHYELANEL